MGEADEVTIQEAAQVAGLTPEPYARDDAHPEAWRSNRPGAEASADLEAMLGASRRGKRVGGKQA